jgi:hypothetical protein
MKLATTRTALLCACSLLLLAGCSKSTNQNGATTVNTTTTTNSTANASRPAASPQPTAQPTATGTDVGRSLKSAKPEDAARGLFNAWKAKDRAAASRYASDTAIKTLFDEGSAEGLEFQGCNIEETGGDYYNCAYTYEGGAVFMQVTGSDTAGYKVTGAGFVAD